MFSKAQTFLRQADWLDAARARAWCNILLVMTGLGITAWCALSHDGLDLTGKPLGTDFMSFYAASKLVLAGHAAAAYDIPVHHAAQNAIFGRDLGYAAFFYPPLFLLICAPLALAPYFGALATWLGATGAAYVATTRAWLGERLGWGCVLAFPAVLINLGHGQNAFLSAALLGSGAMWLNRRPVLAGVMFGLLAYKPHLGLILPIVLIVSRRWTTFAAAAVTVLAFTGASLGLLGSGAWQGFLADSALARATLDHSLVDPGKMISAFTAVRVLGGGAGPAYALQAVVTLYVAASLVRALARAPRGDGEAPLLIMATLLASPFLLDYDLVILALPLAWLARTGAQDGFRPWEKLALLAGFVLPLASRPLAMNAHLPIAPLVLLALFQLIQNRAAPAARTTLATISAAPNAVA